MTDSKKKGLSCINMNLKYMKKKNGPQVYLKIIIFILYYNNGNLFKSNI